MFITPWMLSRGRGEVRRGKKEGGKDKNRRGKIRGGRKRKRRRKWVGEKEQSENAGRQAGRVYSLLSSHHGDFLCLQHL